MVSLYRVIVAFRFKEMEVVVQAENANDAAITGLQRLGLISLELVKGIDIQLCSASSEAFCYLGGKLLWL